MSRLGRLAKTLFLSSLGSTAGTLIGMGLTPVNTSLVNRYKYVRDMLRAGLLNTHTMAGVPVGMAAGLAAGLSRRGPSPLVNSAIWSLISSLGAGKLLRGTKFRYIP